MRELHVQRRQFVEQSAVDHAHRRDHQRELPAEHAAEIVGIHVLPADDVGQRVDEHVEAEIGGRAPERTQRLGVERLPLQFRADHDARKLEIDRAALHLRRRFRGLQRRHMRKADEAAGKIVGRLLHAVVDQPADREIGLIEAGAAGENAGVDAGAVHHPDMRGEVRQQRIEQIGRIAVLIEQDRDRVAVALQQLRRRVVLLEIDDHSIAPLSRTP